MKRTNSGLHPSVWGDVMSPPACPWSHLHHRISRARILPICFEVPRTWAIRNHKGKMAGELVSNDRHLAQSSGRFVALDCHNWTLPFFQVASGTCNPLTFLLPPSFLPQFPIVALPFLITKWVVLNLDCTWELSEEFFCSFYWESGSTPH